MNRIKEYVFHQENSCRERYSHFEVEGNKGKGKDAAKKRLMDSLRALGVRAAPFPLLQENEKYDCGSTYHVHCCRSTGPKMRVVVSVGIAGVGVGSGMRDFP